MARLKNTIVSTIPHYDINKHNVPSIETIMKNTAFKSYEKAEAAVQTLIWLESGAPEKFDGLPGKFKFDMTTYVTNENNVSTGCGTACCIAGSMVAYMSLKDNLDLSDHDARDLIFNKSDWLTDRFDIEDEEDQYDPLVRLFYPKTENGDIRAVKPAIAARTLRRYMETGVVDYRKTPRTKKVA